MLPALIGSLTLLLALILYILLALGLPLGEYAMGGQYRVLPKPLRIAVALSALVQVLGILVLLQLGGVAAVGLPHGLAKALAYFFGGFLALNVFSNALSKSKKERLIMTPLSAVTAFCFLYTAINA